MRVAMGTVHNYTCDTVWCSHVGPTVWDPRNVPRSVGEVCVLPFSAWTSQCQRGLWCFTGTEVSTPPSNSRSISRNHKG